MTFTPSTEDEPPDWPLLARRWTGTVNFMYPIVLPTALIALAELLGLAFYDLFIRPVVPPATDTSTLAYTGPSTLAYTGPSEGLVNTGIPATDATVSGWGLTAALAMMVVGVAVVFLVIRQARQRPRDFTQSW